MNPRSKLRVGMISTHPCSEGGVAHYTKDLIQSLARPTVGVVLFSNRPSMKESTSSKGSDLGNQSICVCWKRGLWYPFQIFEKVIGKDLNIIHVQHEFFLFGDSLSAGLFPLLLLLLKFLRRPIVVTLHGVVPLSEVDKQFLEENTLSGLSMMFKLASVFTMKAILLLANAVIVHERYFVKVLRNDYKCASKIFMISHGVKEADKKLTQGEAKGKLGLSNRRLILFFGYICRYKGLETLIEGFGQIAKKHKDWILIIGGGEHPRLRINASYRNYIADLQQRAFSLAPHQTIFTGFISEEELPVYFSAVDLVVFPHNVALSASGSLACALGYKKPVLLSKIAPFEEIMDIEEAFFDKDSPKSFASRLEFLIDNSEARQRILDNVERLTIQMSWSNVCLETIRLYESQLGLSH